MSGRGAPMNGRGLTPADPRRAALPRLLGRSWLRRTLEATLGATLVALGVRVATEPR